MPRYASLSSSAWSMRRCRSPARSAQQRDEREHEQRRALDACRSRTRRASPSGASARSTARRRPRNPSTARGAMRCPSAADHAQRRSRRRTARRAPRGRPATPTSAAEGRRRGRSRASARARATPLRAAAAPGDRIAQRPRPVAQPCAARAPPRRREARRRSAARRASARARAGSGWPSRCRSRTRPATRAHRGTTKSANRQAENAGPPWRKQRAEHRPDGRAAAREREDEACAPEQACVVRARAWRARARRRAGPARPKVPPSRSPSDHRPPICAEIPSNGGSRITLSPLNG